MKNTIPYTLIDTAGQTTAVIDVPIPRSQQPKVAKPLMEKIKNIGQVCFIENENGTPRLQMMGNELSINGLCAGSFYLFNKLNKKIITISCSGLKDKIRVLMKNKTILIKFPKSIIKLTKNKYVSINGGIKYLIENSLKNSEEITIIQKKELRLLANKFPASGIVYYQNNKIQPLIFVKATNTFVWETSCGSGSIAFARITNQNEIIQPSGKITSVRFTKKYILYETEVKYEL